MRPALWKEQGLTRRQWKNDEWRRARGWDDSSGTWVKVARTASPAVLFCAGVLAVIGVGSHRAEPSTRPLAASPVHSSGPAHRWREPEPTTTVPPTTTVAPQKHAPAPRASRSRPPRSNAEIEACIARRENGGDYGRSSNPTHFGKYQYDRQTWVAHGGNASDWGSASPAEQERVFRNGVSQYGYGAWTKYDGC